MYATGSVSSLGIKNLTWRAVGGRAATTPLYVRVPGWADQATYEVVRADATAGVRVDMAGGARRTAGANASTVSAPAGTCPQHAGKRQDRSQHGLGSQQARTTPYPEPPYPTPKPWPRPYPSP